MKKLCYTKVSIAAEWSVIGLIHEVWTYVTASGRGACLSTASFNGAAKRSVIPTCALEVIHC